MRGKSQREAGLPGECELQLSERRHATECSESRSYTEHFERLFCGKTFPVVQVSCRRTLGFIQTLLSCQISRRPSIPLRERYWLVSLFNITALYNWEPSPSTPKLIFVCFAEKESHYIALAGLELVM